MHEDLKRRVRELEQAYELELSEPDADMSTTGPVQAAGAALCAARLDLTIARLNAQREHELSYAANARGVTEHARNDARHAAAAILCRLRELEADRDGDA